MMMMVLMVMVKVLLMLMVMVKIITIMATKMIRRSMKLKFRLMNFKTLDPHSKALFYHKNLSVTPLQVYRLYVIGNKISNNGNSCCHIKFRLMRKNRYIKEISLTFVVVKYTCEM